MLELGATVTFAAFVGLQPALSTPSRRGNSFDVATDAIDRQLKELSILRRTEFMGGTAAGRCVHRPDPSARGVFRAVLEVKPGTFASACLIRRFRLILSWIRRIRF